MLVLRTNLPVRVSAEGEIHGSTRLRAGEVIQASLTFADDSPAVLPPLGDRSRDAVARSCGWWRDWTSRLQYDGPCRGTVIRSALALKLLVYAPSGAIVAAPTTSLPERVGGDLNWDCRFCWLRDAALTVRALVGLGYLSEAQAFASWLLHTTRLTQPELQILYDVHGVAPPAERVLQEFAGYQSSRPVRIGNAAAGQRQLDVYGEVIDAVTHFVAAGGTLDGDTERMLCAFGEYVCQHWGEPDEGIWEPRSGQALHTHSRVLCWTALDRLLQLHGEGHLRRAPVMRFREHRERIRREVETRGWNPVLGSYVSQLDGDDLDATLLLLPWYGFEEAGSQRMRSTYRRVRERLDAGNALLYRYRTADLPGEGAFGICSFWGAECLALGGGTVDEALDLFERVCAHANDVGLFGEQIDPVTGAALGNFPQAFTHVGLINAAVTLARRLAGAPPIERRLPRRSEVRRHESAYELGQLALVELRRDVGADDGLGRQSGASPDPHEHPVHARHDVHAQSRPGEARGLRHPSRERVALFVTVPGSIPRVGARDVVERRGDRSRTQCVRADGRHAASPGAPPTDGERTNRGRL